MKKSSFNKSVIFIIKVLVLAGVTVSVIMFTFIILFIKEVRDYHKMGEENNKNIADEYLIAVENHLESKYGKKFSINPNWKSIGGGSPIPFSEDHSPIYCEVYAKDDLDFPFRVFVYPMSDKNRSIKEIRDSYCWKFLRKKLRKMLKDQLKDVLPAEYKLLIESGSNITFENYVTPTSSIEECFKSYRFHPTIYLYMYVYNSNEKMEQKLKQNTLLLLSELENNTGNINIELTYYVIKNKDDYDSIDVKREEKGNLMVYRNKTETSYKQIPSMEKEEKFKVEIESGDKLDEKSYVKAGKN